MPVYLRRFYLDQLQLVFEEKHKHSNKQNKNLKDNTGRNWGSSQSTIGSKNPYSK